MKLRSRPPVFALLLLSILSPSFTSSIPAPAREKHVQRVARDSIPESPAADKGPVSSKLNSVGTKDAPVDGKDGKPHAGPFIETEAERGRKKAKESSDEEPAIALAPKVLGKEQADLRPSNDGVMDDPNRLGPKDGTRGTEGGVSEKSKENSLGIEKTPDAPKEAPPLPHSEQEMIPGTQAGDSWAVKEEDKNLLEKSTDHSNSHEDYSDQSKSPSPEDIADPVPKSPSNQRNTAPDAESGVIQPLHSFLLSLAMILFSEIGDKTFIVAALMAMRHPRMVVFSAAFAAMIVMTVLSAFLGHALPAVIPKSLTNFLAAGLFLVFGVKMYLEARKMSPDEGVSEEMKEVEMELEEKEHRQRKLSRRRSSVGPYMLESGRAGRAGRQSRSNTTRLPSPPDSPSPSSSRDTSPSRSSFASNALNGINNLLSLLLSPAWVQTFVMTFLGEWGDRSQIATIAMAAGQDYWWVIAGALGGHFFCTGAAVLGGAAIAGKVSLKVVTMGGAIAFLVFGFIYLFEAIY